jgi:hypothetical protein
MLRISLGSRFFLTCSQSRLSISTFQKPTSWLSRKPRHFKNDISTCPENLDTSKPKSRQPQLSYNVEKSQFLSRSQLRLSISTFQKPTSWLLRKSRHDETFRSQSRLLSTVETRGPSWNTFMEMEVIRIWWWDDQLMVTQLTGSNSLILMWRI